MSDNQLHISRESGHGGFNLPDSVGESFSVTIDLPAGTSLREIMQLLDASEMMKKLTDTKAVPRVSTTVINNGHVNSNATR